MEYIPKFQKGKKLPELPLFDSDPKAFVDSVLTANKDLEWVERLWPTVRRSNSLDNIIPGQHSTHLMSHDGQGYVFPKIVRDVDTKKLRYLPTDDEAREYALRTNTGIKFETPEQADWFTKNYKIGTGVFGKNPKPSLMFEEGDQLPKFKSGKKLPELETYRKFEASADNTKTVPANNKVQQSNNLKRAAEIRQRREDMKPPTSNVPISERLLTNLKNVGNIMYESGKPLLLAGTAGMASMAPYGSSLASVAKSMLAGTAVDQMYHDFGGKNLGDAANIQNPTGRFIANMVSPGGFVGYNAGLKTAQRVSNVYKLNRSKKLQEVLPKDFSGFKDVESAENFIQKWSRFNLNDEIVNESLIKEYGPKYSLSNLQQMLNNDAIVELDALNLIVKSVQKHSNNFKGWKTKQDYDKLTKNISGFPKTETFGKSKIQNGLITLLPNSIFKKTVFTPKGNLKIYTKPETALKEVADNVELSTRKAYIDKFNNNLITLNDIINRNNTSGVPYRVVGLTDEKLKFTSSLGDQTFSIDISPGKFTGEVKDLANYSYYENLPGIRMVNTGNSVFGDAVPRRGSKAYESINEYLKLLNMGRVKSGFNSQTMYSRGLWRDLIRKNKAIGYYNDEKTIYAIMKGLAPFLGLKSLNDSNQDKE